MFSEVIISGISLTLRRIYFRPVVLSFEKFGAGSGRGRRHHKIRLSAVLPPPPTIGLHIFCSLPYYCKTISICSKYRLLRSTQGTVVPRLHLTTLALVISNLLARTSRTKSKIHHAILRINAAALTSTVYNGTSVTSRNIYKVLTYHFLTGRKLLQYDFRFEMFLHIQNLWLATTFRFNTDFCSMKYCKQCVYSFNKY